MNRRTVFVAVVLAVVLAGGIYFAQKNRGIPSAVSSSKNGEKAKGPANAPVQIVEYSDFQCPACMKAQSVLNAIMEEYPGKIRLIFHHYPLPMHQWAGVAHQAAECANVQGKFWEFHDKVYQNQTIWSAAPNVPEFLISYAKEAGLDLDAFGVCLSNADITKKIMEERAGGSVLRLSSTPTFFINGERVVGQMELENNGRNIVRKLLGLPPRPVQIPPAPVLPPVPAGLQPQTPVPATLQKPPLVRDTSSANSSQN